MATGNKTTNRSNRPAGRPSGNQERYTGGKGNDKRAAANSKRAKAKARRKRRRIILGVEILVLLLLLAVLYFVTKIDKIGKVDLNEENIFVDEDVANNETLQGFRNIALFGVDSRDGALGKGTRTDTIIIASINQDTKDVKLVSVYRDTYLNLSTDKYGKANSAYSRGGPEQAINMLNMNLDMNITDFVTVDFNAMVKTIDLLGGIEIDIQQDEISHLNNYTVETSEVTGVKTEKIKNPGLQLLDGVQAVSYCRIRYTAGDDYKRTERQRLVLQKIFEKAKTTSLGTLNKIIDEVLQPEYVNTSLTNTEIIELAAAVANYNIVDTGGFPFDKTSTKISGESSVIPVDLSSNVIKLHEFLFDGSEVYTESNTVKKISQYIAEKTGFYADDSDDSSGSEE